MISITPFKQTDDSRCGPAVIKMILSYYGIDASEDELCSRCGWTYALGCTDYQMLRAIESYGLVAEAKEDCTLEEVEFWISQDIPIIVDWFTGGVNPALNDVPEGHSSIVVDIDEERIHLLDPELGGIRSILREDFMRVWFDWREHPTIQEWSDLVLRQIIVVRPK